METPIRSRAWFFFFLLALGVATGARAQVDASTLRLQGARAEGGMLLPSSRVLDRLGWDLSLTYGHEDGVVRTEVPTDQVRGKSLFREVGWIESRDLLYLQLAASPADRLELLAGLPLLLGQEVGGDGVDTLPAAPSSGSTAFGDLRLGLRYALVGGGGGPWGASLQGAILIPSGESAHAMGDGRARANLAGSVGYEGEEGWAAHLHLGHQMGQRLGVGDQLLGDAAHGGLLLLYRHAVGAQRLQWSLEGVMTSILSASEPGPAPSRTSLELLGGARYFVDALYVDLGAGVGAIDAGATPAWRLLASVGVRGSWAHDPASPPPPQRVEAPAPMPPPVIQVIQPTEAQDPREAYRVLEVEERVIFFEVGKAELDPVAQSVLRTIALNLLESERRVLISGFADDQGSPERNEELSRRRAQVVRDALVQAGIAPERLEIRGQGDREPAAPSTDFGRSINRRVTFTFVD